MKKVLFLAVLLFIITGCGEKKEEQEPCYPITGGSFNIIFETNSDTSSIPSISVCIACSPDSYEDLPIIDDYYKESSGWGFVGWYYDSELTKKVEGTSTLDIKPVPNDPKCVTDYNDITLYAKWEKIIAD